MQRYGFVLRGARASLLVALFLATGCGAAPEMASAAPDYPASGGTQQAGYPSPMPAGADEAGVAAAPAQGKATGAAGAAQPSVPGAQPRSQPGAPPAPAPANAKSVSNAEPKSTAPKPLIAYTGALSMLADGEQIPDKLDGIVGVAESFGGHLAGRTNDSVKVKIPSDSYREAVSKIEKIAEVTERNVHADDVTAEFRDLEVRLENLKATRKRLEEFLAKTSTLADMLTLERELERVSTEMDVIAGRLRMMRDMTSMSELSVRIAARPKPVIQVVENKTPPPPPPPPPPRAIDLPVPWLGTLGMDTLLTLPTPS
ncbi:MAG TPA: DUF4349 domain-containing protein [Polyangiaceae bacterium]|nr:DUF4349 domain-containing protein [Polyangiaceae bacterium]